MKTNQQFKILRQLKNVIPENERHNFSITDIKIGGFLRIKFYGKDSLFYVEDIYTYKYKKEKWYELKLFNVLTGETSFLEYEIDDTIEYYFTEKSLKKREWPASLSEIQDMAEEEDGSIYFNGVEYWYEDDYKAKFTRASSDKEEKVYIYEFEPDNEEDGGISFELWDDGDGEAFFYKKLDPTIIEVVSTGN
jgi:hypothetical protein